MNLFRVFRPALMQQEGLDTSTFFGDQAMVDESTLPDVSVAGDAPGNPQQEEPAPTPDPTPQPLADETIEHEGKDGQRKQFVPLGALQEERTKRQDAQQRETQLLERMNRLLEAQAQAQLQTQQPQQEPEKPIEIPAFVDDPEGHLNALKQQFQRELDTIRQGQAQTSQQQQAQQQLQQLAATVGQQEAAYRQTTPEYDQALAFFNERKTAEYMALGLDAGAAAQQLARDYQGLAIRAQQANTNPAQMLHNIAKALGFTAQQQPQQGQQPPKQAPTSLSTINGSSRAPDQRGNVTAKDIATMSNEDFDKFFNDMAKGSTQRPAI